MGACSPKPARGQHRDISLLPTVASCCQRSEAGQSSAQGRWLLLDARLSEPASHPYLLLSTVWTPPQAFLQPPCHLQSRLCLDFRGRAFVGFIFLSLGVSHLLRVDSCLLSSSSLSALLKLALLRLSVQWLPMLLTLFPPCVYGHIFS